MTEQEETLRKAISYCIEFYDNKEATNRIIQFIKDDRALQLLQTGVIVQSEQLKTCEHNFADVYDHTGTQIVGKKCLNGCGF